MLLSVLVIVLFSLTNCVVCNEDEETIELKIPKEVQDAISQFLSENPDFGKENMNPDEDLARGFTVPGTNYCGPGNTSENGELGLFADTDKCCQVHDSCEPAMKVGDFYEGLHNRGDFTRLHCDCENTFYTCLRNVNSFVSNSIGNIYFNHGGQKCFKEDVYVTGCKRKGKIVYTNIANIKQDPRNWVFKKLGKCLEYEYDYDMPKKLNWFDVPYYD